MLLLSWWDRLGTRVRRSSITLSMLRPSSPSSLVLPSPPLHLSPPSPIIPSLQLTQIRHRAGRSLDCSRHDLLGRRRLVRPRDVHRGPPFCFSSSLVRPPYDASQAAVDSLGLKESMHWQPWIVDTQVAGYTKAWNGNFYFATVKGAGTLPSLFRSQHYHHLQPPPRPCILLRPSLTFSFSAGHMVPAYKPAQGLALFSRFISNKH